MSTVPFPSPPLSRHRENRADTSPHFHPIPIHHWPTSSASTPFLAFSPVLKPSSPARAFESLVAPRRRTGPPFCISTSCWQIGQIGRSGAAAESPAIAHFARKIQTSPFLPSFYHHLSRSRGTRSSFSFRVGSGRANFDMSSRCRGFRTSHFIRLY